ncbi:serine/threonine protein kinase [Nitzschia inconspicua]|uniref:Serine/threonine protein kinase n=1 Tax=Nitzschia inconspicua TaxID=303405 RepID=A0A9K3LQI9_9STRA|nr:serine/threonine protein kinase [Nitzschia inconspicua]
MTGVAFEEDAKAKDAGPSTEMEYDKDSIFCTRYIMKNQFAKGSYGTVWVASPKTDPEKEYAVKVIDRSKLREKDQESVHREVQVLKELQDLPNVIPLVDFLEEPRYLYMVQFYAQGGDLFRRLTQRKQYTEKDARDIAVILFQTLDDMHTKHQIVHRDLKPENLLLEDLLTEKIYFADFGFARHVTEEGLKTRCGTPAFVAPEIILGERYKTSVDMWSIGVILFMMLGGYPPFHMEAGGSDLRMLFRKVRAGDFTFHESQWKTVSPQAKCLISRLLTVDPEYRFTAREALESDWVAKLDGQKLSQIDLSASLTSLKKFDGRLSLKGAMNAVKFVISANFWNAEAITFSRQTRKQVISDRIVDEALNAQAKTKFDDEYEVLRKIRKGSCATVYECRHKGTKEIFAVKIIRRAKLKPSEDEFVLNEVSIMQSLSAYGEYVVQLLDFYEEPEYFYLVMDYMGAGDVFDRILKKTKYAESDARKLTKILLKATQCMHEAGVAHRDLKPQNLLLSSEEDDAKIKITDFGFARRVHTPQSLTSRCGTPTFVAPEILKNIPHDQSADLWSIGVIVYLLLVGYPPFMKDTQAELFQQIRSCDWKFHKNDWANISTEAMELIEHLLVPDPVQRWTADQALACAWIQDESSSSTQVDLMTSIESLRERRARLRQFNNPVVWKKDGDSTPVDASLKINDAIGDEGSTGSIAAAAS